MRLYVSGSSALHYWRRDLQGDKVLERLVPDPLTDCPVDRSQLSAIDCVRDLFGPAPIHLMARSCEQRIRKDTYEYCVSRRPLPETAFRQLNERICLASPELCLLQSLKAYPHIKFIELCMELCGKYSLVREASRGFLSRDFQLASVASIEAFLRNMSGAKDIEAFRKTIGFIQEGSRSPMETRMYLFMCLPKRLGGYGLPKPVMNMRIELSIEEQRVSKRRYFECDLCWPEKHVVIEYDGHEDHAMRGDRDRDSIKRNILLSKGFAVFTITGGQICDARSFDKVVREIAKRIGYRLQGFPPGWAERRRALRNDLFASMRSSEWGVVDEVDVVRDGRI